MGKDNKEALFNFYIAYKNKEILSDVLEIKINNLCLEWYFEGRKIDIYGMDDFNRQVFVETQLGVADAKHEEQVIQIIRKSRKPCIIVWLAYDFRDVFIEKIINLIREENKQIDFFAVKINRNVDDALSDLCKIHALKQIDNINLLDKVEDTLEMYYKHLACEIEAPLEIKMPKFSFRWKTNKCIADKVRINAKFINFFNEKREWGNNYFCYGAGNAYVEIKICFFAKDEKAYVQLRFIGRAGEEIYNYLKTKENVLYKKIGHSIEFSDKNQWITGYLDKNYHAVERMDRLAEVANKIIEVTINYTVYWNNTDMWEQNPNGIL